MLDGILLTFQVPGEPSRSTKSRSSTLVSWASANPAVEQPNDSSRYSLPSRSTGVAYVVNTHLTQPRHKGNAWPRFVRQVRACELLLCRART